MRLNREKIAKIIRVITAPPFMATAFLIVIYFVRNDIFRSLNELIVSMLLLGILPLLAYPFSAFIPALRKKGRSGQRLTAFVFNLFGFVAVVSYGEIIGVTCELMMVYLTYLFSVIVLIVFNKGFKIRASGHASAISGPLILLIYFTGSISVVPCLLVFAGVVWSSLVLKRHSLCDLEMGAITTIIAACISWTLSII